MGEYYELHGSNKYDNLEAMGTVLERQKLPKLTLKKLKNLKTLSQWKTVHSKCKSFLEADLDTATLVCSSGYFEQKCYHLNTNFQKIEERMLHSSDLRWGQYCCDMKACQTMRKENYRCLFLMNTGTKYLTKLQQIRFNHMWKGDPSWPYEEYFRIFYHFYNIWNQHRSFTMLMQ